MPPERISSYPVSDLFIPEPLRRGLRGVGQVFFQENALSGICFLVGIALGSPLMALGAALGAAIGTAVATFLRFDESEVSAGIHGFNPTLVGIATFFFFRPGVGSVGLLISGCVVATLLTRVVRRYVPFTTYTAPFIVTTWVLFFLGQATGVARVTPGGPLEVVGLLGAAAHGVSQVMFQASVWTALLFLAGIALSDWKHAAWVLTGSIVGMLVASHHTTAAARVLDPESLVQRSVPEAVALGLYGYNATLAAVALWLWRRSLIPPLLGIFFSVLLTDLVPLLGLPALTAPFVLATWLVLVFGWLDRRFLQEPGPAST